MMYQKNVMPLGLLSLFWNISNIFLDAKTAGKSRYEDIHTKKAMEREATEGQYSLCCNNVLMIILLDCRSFI